MDDPRWLDDEEQRAWGGLMSFLPYLDLALDRQLQRDAGISHLHYAILANLSNADAHTLHMSELAERTATSQSRLSHAVQRMEDAGLVARSRCPVNGRAVHAALTGAGEERLATAAPAHVAEVRRLLFDQLTRAQVRHLAAITERALAVLVAEVATPVRSAADETAP